MNTHERMNTPAATPAAARAEATRRAEYAWGIADLVRSDAAIVLALRATGDAHAIAGSRGLGSWIATARATAAKAEAGAAAAEIAAGRTGGATATRALEAALEARAAAAAARAAADGAPDAAERMAEAEAACAPRRSREARVNAQITSAWERARVA